MEISSAALGIVNSTNSFTCAPESAAKCTVSSLGAVTTDRIVTVGVRPSTGTAADAMSWSWALVDERILVAVTPLIVRVDSNDTESTVALLGSIEGVNTG